MYRSLVLSEDITNCSVSKIISDILKINFEDDSNATLYKDFKREPIRLYINTFGGNVYDGLALLDVIKNSKTPVYTICLGACMSAGLFIWLGGAKRIIGKNATLMYHDISIVCKGKTELIIQEIDELKRLQNIVINEIISRSQIKEDTIRDYISRRAEWYIPADKAIELKLADEYYDAIQEQTSTEVVN